MKKVLVSVLLIAGLFIFAVRSWANEGTVRLIGPSEDGGACFAASVYVDGTYRILMTCRGLKMALDPVRNKFVVWASVGEGKKRLGEIINGKLAAGLTEEFDNLFVTLELDAYASKPTGVVALTGEVVPIDFGKASLNTTLTSLVTLTPVVTGTKIDEGGVTPTTNTNASGRLTSVVVGIGKAILFGFILLLIVVGVMSFLARRKNL